MLPSRIGAPGFDPVTSISGVGGLGGGAGFGMGAIDETSTNCRFGSSWPSSSTSSSSLFIGLKNMGL